MMSVLYERDQVINDFNNKNLNKFFNYIHNMNVSVWDYSRFKSSIDYEYLKQLYDVFLHDEKLLEIIRYIPSGKNNKIDQSQLLIKSYMIYIYIDRFLIYIIDVNNQIIEYPFTLSLDYEHIDFLKDLKYSNFNNDNIEKGYLYYHVYMKIYKEFKNNSYIHGNTYVNENEHDDINELKWDVLKHNIEIYNNEEISNIINNNINNLSLLINFINYLDDHPIEELKESLYTWIIEYLKWYQKEGKEKVQRSKSVRYVKNIYWFDSEADESKEINDMEELYINNNCIIAEHGIYEKIPKYKINVEDIEILINQVYYTLAQLIHNKENTNEDDKINILRYLEKANDHKDAKELKKRLFYHYLGFDMGKELDLDFEDKGIVMAYKMAKLLRK